MKIKYALDNPVGRAVKFASNRDSLTITRLSALIIQCMSLQTVPGPQRRKRLPALISLCVCVSVQKQTDTIIDNTSEQKQCNLIKKTSFCV